MNYKFLIKIIANDTLKILILLVISLLTGILVNMFHFRGVHINFF